MTASPAHSPFRPALRLSARDAQAINTLARRTARFSIALGQSGHRWQCSLIASGPVQPPAEDDIWLQLEWDGAQLVIRLPRHAIHSWLESQMPGVQFSTLPHAVATAALDVWINQMLSAFPDSTAGTVRVVQHTTRPDAGYIDALPLTWALTLRSSDTSAPIHAALRCDTAALGKLSALAQALPPTRGPVDIHALRADVHVVIGRTSLPAAMFNSLENGDVVMLDQCRIDPDGQFWLALGESIGLRLRPEQGRYTVTQGWTPLMTESSTDLPNQDTVVENAAQRSDDNRPDDTGTTDADTANTPPELQDFDDVAINLSFDLGQRRLSLSELQALQPGELFDLARPLNDGPVHIRANGTLIGYGELVDIDGRVGVQVSRLGSPR